MRIAAITAVPGGYRADVEFEAAYTDGSSRFERVFLARDDVHGNPAEAIRRAVRDAIDEDAGFAALQDADLDTIPVTKATLERQMVALFEEWQRWKATTDEAAARGEPLPVRIALASRTDAAWARYRTSIQAWRVAP